MTITITDPQEPVIFNISQQVNPLPVDLIRKFCKVSIGDTSVTAETVKAVTKTDWTTYVTAATETAYWMTAFFAQAPNATAYILETASSTTLATFVDANPNLFYLYSVPASLYADATFVTLVKAYTAITDLTYFAVEITHGATPVGDSNFTAYASAKSLFAVYGNGVSTESVSGAMVGVMAGPLYDISASNKCTMFNYSRLNGITVEALSSSLRSDLNDSGVNYVGEIAGVICVFNGRNLDLNTWEYWFEWDWFQIAVSNAITAAIVNGANVPSAAIRYDQNGIDSIKIVTNGVGNNGKSNGAVTDFGATWDIVKGQISGLGSFAAIPFYTYIAANPDKYAAGIYDGISGYVLIGRYIREVTLNVTIN